MAPNTELLDSKVGGKLGWHGTPYSPPAGEEKLGFVLPTPCEQATKLGRVVWVRVMALLWQGAGRAGWVGLDWAGRLARSAESPTVAKL